MSPRRRLRIEQGVIAIAAVLLFPVALPILAIAVWLDNIGRAREMPRPRYGCWFWRLWWWYGYHGLYRLDWLMKERA